MKIDFTATIFDPQGGIVMEGDSPVGIDALLKRAVLADNTPDGKPIPPTEKYPRFELYMKLRQATSDTDFSTDEVQLLEKAVLAFPTLIAGQLTYLLHNKCL